MRIGLDWAFLCFLLGFPLFPIGLSSVPYWAFLCFLLGFPLFLLDSSLFPVA